MQDSLFGPTYAIDTCSIMGISRSYSEDDASAVWNGVEGLIGAGRLKSVTLVMEDLRKWEPQSAKRLAPLRRHFIVPDAQLAGEAGRIMRQYPSIGSPKSRRDKADTWLVALARLRRYTLVTEENRNRKKKLPHVCRAEGIKCIDLQDLVAREALIP